MFIRNINKFRAEKRYAAKTTSGFRKASGPSKKSCSSWDRAEIRAGLNKYLAKIRKYHEDPFLAEGEESGPEAEGIDPMTDEEWNNWVAYVGRIDEDVDGEPFHYKFV